jgi:uncharacterized membrane protein
VKVTRSDVGAVVLALFWLAMGVLHFADHAETVRQMPSYFPLKDPIVVITGVLEIVAALALVPRQTRAFGALGTMILLVLYTPAVIHIVQHDATPVAWPSWERAAFRWGVIPANIGLFFWARVYWRGR